jgi:hypothetical protein
MKTKILVMASVIGLFAANFGFAQVNPFIQVNIPFQFMVGKKALPAGAYDLKPDALEEAIQVSPAKKGEPGAEVVLVTRLAAEVHNADTGYAVFDKIGNTYFLSEIWIPEMDGFLVNAPKVKHEHRIIKAS